MITKKKILVTGINGFIGSHIAADFRNNYDIYGLDIGAVCSVTGIHKYSQMNLPNGDFEDLIRYFLPDYCIHCAGSASVPLSVAHPSIDFDAGPSTTFHIQDAIRKSGIPCITIFCSSAAVYGNSSSLPISEESPIFPLSPYGYHKVMSETILEEFRSIYGLPYIILRIFSTYGIGLRKQLFWDACQKILMKDPLFWGTGDETRDFIHVNDIARLIKLIVELKLKNKIFNVGSGSQISVRFIVENIAECLEYPKDNIRFKGNTRKGDPLNWQADVSRIRDIDFKNEILLEEGILDYVQWVKSLKNR